MKRRIYQSTYKNIDCITMESDQLIIKVIPESGNKIQSIYDKKLKKEYLFQSTHKEFIKSTYDSSFGIGDASGF